MKQKIKNILEKHRKFIVAGVGATTMLLPTIAHAEVGNVSSTISGSMQTIVTDTITTFAAIAPIGIVIFGASFAWKKGLKFFKQVTNN